METNKPTPTLAALTPAQFEEALARYAAAGLRGLEINKAIEAEIAGIIEKYEDELTLSQQSRDAAYEVVKNYCIHNKKALFKSRRSMGTPYGTIGFRLGTPRIKTRKGKNWTNILGNLKEKLPEYIRIFEEPAKDRLLADRYSETVAPLLNEIGIEVVQEDLFYIEPQKAA